MRRSASSGLPSVAVDGVEEGPALHSASSTSSAVGGSTTTGRPFSWIDCNVSTSAPVSDTDPVSRLHDHRRVVGAHHEPHPPTVLVDHRGGPARSARGSPSVDTVPTTSPAPESIMAVSSDANRHPLPLLRVLGRLREGILTMHVRRVQERGDARSFTMVTRSTRRSSRHLREEAP